MTEHVPPPPATSEAALRDAHDVVRRLLDRLRSAVIGRDEVLELVVIALLADGHVLLEDFPGSGKTTLAKALGESILDDRPDSVGTIDLFRRIQFTPDLLPSDVTGTSIFDPQSGQFTFRRGPIFAHVVLADEINRTSPKVQAALLEAMAEKQVTVDNETFPLDALFFVIATQNPLDLAGTFPLPVAQLDRFLFKIRMTHIDRAAELDVLRTTRTRRQDGNRPPAVKRSEILAARAAVDEAVYIHPAVQEALVDTATRVRHDARVLQGVSTRALVLLLPALQVRAMIYRRDFVAGEDLEALVPRVFGHRVELGAGADSLEGVIDDAVRPAVEALARGTLRGKW